jgi:hypothetical protein
MRYLSFALISILALPLQSTFAEDEFYEAKLEWSSDRCTGLAQTITLTELDMNKNPKSAETVGISIISDSDPKGVTVKLQETALDTGIFEGNVVFSSTGYSKEPLAASNGDKVTAIYQDETLPRPVFSGKLGISDICIYTLGGPPVERAPAEYPRIIADGKRIDTIRIDQQVQVVADLVNNQDREQPFAYLVQIQNSNEVTVSLSWITGNLSPGQMLSPSQSWLPTETGSYNVQIFVWEGIDNPDALSPPLFIEVQVSDENTSI